MNVSGIVAVWIYGEAGEVQYKGVIVSQADHRLASRTEV